MSKRLGGTSRLILNNTTEIFSIVIIGMNCTDRDNIGFVNIIIYHAIILGFKVKIKVK